MTVVRADTVVTVPDTKVKRFYACRASQILEREIESLPAFRYLAGMSFWCRFSRRTGFLPDGKNGKDAVRRQNRFTGSWKVFFRVFAANGEKSACNELDNNPDGARIILCKSLIIKI